MDNINKQMSYRLNRNSFPQGFIFGSGTSAYQVEGAYNEDGNGLSNWDVFTRDHPDKIMDRSNGNVAIDQYHRYVNDVALMKDIGIDAYRFSISWSRILPGGRSSKGINNKGVEYYNNLINTLIDHDIKPVATIFHFDLPQCLEDEYGGFLDRKVVDDFADYADVCFSKFGDRVKTWVTENEPWTYTHHGYVTGNFPPEHGSSSSSSQWRNLNLVHRSAPIPVSGRKRKMHESDSDSNNRDATEPYTVAHNLILSHAKAVDIYRTKYKDKQGGQIGVTNMCTWYDPYHSDCNDDIAAANRAVDFMWGWFVAPIVKGDYPAVMRERVKERLPKFTDEEKKMVQGSYDFIGMNYYTTNWATYKKKDPGAPDNYYNDQEVDFKTEREDGTKIGKQAGSSWLYVVPYGIHSLLKHIYDNYNNPTVYVTENGTDEKNDTPLPNALKDQPRIDYHNDHLSYVKKAIDEGSDIKGYYTWSMFDNYEWTEGYTVRFGMIYVDYNDGQDLKRYLKDSAKWYKNFLSNSTSTSIKRQVEEEEDVSQVGKNKKTRY